MIILIADDEPDVVEMLNEVFCGEGHEVDIAFDGKRALEYLQSKTYNIAILDHNMPEFTGLELTKYIREHRLPTKVVMISGYPLLAETFAKSLGVDEVVMKPFGLDVIRDVIDRLK